MSTRTQLLLIYQCQTNGDDLSLYVSTKTSYQWQHVKLITIYIVIYLDVLKLYLLQE